MAGHVPADSAAVHVFGGLGRVHRRRHEMPADHALLQILLQRAFPLIHPHAVTHVKDRRQGGARRCHAQRPGVSGPVYGAFCPLLGVAGRLGVDFITAFSAVALPSAISARDSAWWDRWKTMPRFPMPGKWLLIWCMLLGRLEIFTVIILLVPEFYRK